MLYKWTTKIIFGFCLLMIIIFILVQMLEAVSSMYLSFAKPGMTVKIFSREEIYNLIVVLFSIFIGLELLETLKTYLAEGQIKTVLIIEIGLLIVMRKLLTVDIYNSDPLTNIALGVLIACLGLAFFLIKKSTNQAIYKKMQNTKAR